MLVMLERVHGREETVCGVWGLRRLGLLEAQAVQVSPVLALLARWQTAFALEVSALVAFVVLQVEAEPPKWS